MGLVAAVAGLAEPRNRVWPLTPLPLASGQVYKATLRESGEVVAVKVLNNELLIKC